MCNKNDLELPKLLRGVEEVQEEEFTFARTGRRKSVVR